MLQTRLSHHVVNCKQAVLGIFTHNLLVEMKHKYVLKGFPNHTELSTIQAAFSEKDINVSHLRQITKNYTDETNTHINREIPVWVLIIQRKQWQKLKI